MEGHLSTSIKIIQKLNALVMMNEQAEFRIYDPLRRILDDAKKRKNKRKKLNTLDVDKY